MIPLAVADRAAPNWSARRPTHDLTAADAVVLGIVVHRGDNAHLDQSVASLASQTRPLDGIVVAHLGTEESPTWICDRFPEVRVVTASGPASTAALVESIVASLPADGYLFQESTDWSAPTRLEELLRAAADDHAGLIGSDYVLVTPQVPDAHTRRMPRDGNAAFEKGTGRSVIEPCTMLLDGSLIDRLGGFNTTLSIAAGDEFAARAAVVSRIVNVPRVLYFRRVHEASDWSSGTARPSISERIVFAALAERSRLYAVSLARRQPPDVSMVARQDVPTLVLLAGPPITDRLPAKRVPASMARRRSVSARARLDERSHDIGSTVAEAPVFIVSASDSLSRFIACALGQHTRLLTVEVNTWMTQIGQLAARYMHAERQGGIAGSVATTTPETVYRAASAAVDALFVGGPYGGGDDRNQVNQARLRWVGAVPAEGSALAAAALLYPKAQFIHVVRPVDDMVAAELADEDDADVEDLYRAWLTATHAILDLAHVLDPSSMHTVRYDELVACPDAVIGRWLKLLGADPEPACSAFVAPSAADAVTVGPIVDLAGVPAQRDARRLSVALEGTSTGHHRFGRLDALARVLTDGRTEVDRRRRSTDIREDDRNPYAASHDLIRRSAPKHAIVCVVSKGDEMAVRIRGHSLGWHFPQTADGLYVGYHPKDAREAIAHLEHLRDSGATLFLIPEVYLWWLKHYAELRLHLERTYGRIASTEDEGALWDLRPPDERAAEPWGTTA
jgi:hypothetical protein